MPQHQEGVNLDPMSPDKKLKLANAIQGLHEADYAEYRLAMHLLSGGKGYVAYVRRPLKDRLKAAWEAFKDGPRWFPPAAP